MQLKKSTTAFKEHYLYRCLLVFSFGLVITLPTNAMAQNVTINLEVFGLNENQFETNQSLETACTSIAQTGMPSAAANDLLNTCAILNPLNDEDATLAAGLDRLIPEEAFAISDTLTDASDLQVTNVIWSVWGLIDKLKLFFFKLTINA